MQTLREARAARVLTIRELAALAGVSTRTIVQVEAGQIVPRFATLKKIASALGVEPAAITEFARAIEEAGKEEAAA